ncbi:MAG: NAD-dependent epimerase/dehydratase family protein [Halobacteriaceae archaeon]
MTNSTVLVTGGTGFIGSYVAQDLLENGYDVIAYDLSSDTHILEKLGIAQNVTVKQGDVTDQADIIRACKQSDADYIVHLAALLTNGARENPRAALSVNIQGTNNVFETARILDDQIQRVAWASSAAVYAPPKKYDTKWVTEDNLIYPDTLYGATKAYNEHQAKVYSKDYDLSLVGLRPTVAYGPYRETGGSAFLANIIEKPALGESYQVQYGDQTIDWQYVRDIAQAFRRGITTDENALSQRIYNVRGELATIREAAETVKDLIPHADITVSDEGELPWTQTLDMSKAKEDLNYTPNYPIKSGFKEYINVLREEHDMDPIS